MQNSENLFDSIDILVMNTVQDNLTKIISTDPNAYKNADMRNPLFQKGDEVILGGKFSNFPSCWISERQIDL